jgi:hypothetical protein
MLLRILILLALTAIGMFGQFFGGGASGGRSVTWILCNGQPCSVGQNKTNLYIVIERAKVKSCYFFVKVPDSDWVQLVAPTVPLKATDNVALSAFKVRVAADTVVRPVWPYTSHD